MVHLQRVVDSVAMLHILNQWLGQTIIFIASVEVCRPCFTLALYSFECEQRCLILKQPRTSLLRDVQRCLLEGMQGSGRCRPG